MVVQGVIFKKVLSWAFFVLENPLLRRSFALIFIVVNLEETRLFQEKTRPQHLKLGWMFDSLPKHTFKRVDER